MLFSHNFRKFKEIQDYKKEDSHNIMGKTIIISNRLPLQISIAGEDLQVTPSVGGLATGLKTFHQEGESLWIGWTGLSEEEIPDNQKKTVKEKAKKQKCVPVPLTSEEINGFYYGFSNKTLWPLFHYFTEYTEFESSDWESYLKVNQKYADVVFQYLEEGDNVWVHDYQLLLLPSLLRKKNSNISIGFFNHIPFPSYEVFRTLPWREEILEGILGADLIGFHTYDYVRHFLSAVQRILRKDVDFNEIHLGNRLVKVDSFPMGIDYKKFETAAVVHLNQPRNKDSEFQKKLGLQKLEGKNTKLILSIDRLDYTKGIANRIRAFEYFLEKYPQYQEKTRLVILAVPSRTNVPQYQLLKKEIDELVGRINGKFASIGWIPIWYFYRSMPFGNLIDLYTLCDLALITPIRDGMNLVAKEYIATRTKQTGVLILSEMAGSAHELNEALIINPNNFEQIADTIKQGLEMPVEEQKRRMESLQKRLKRYSVEKWANEFMKALKETKTGSKTINAAEITRNTKNEILKTFKKAKKRIFFLDYDGTLVNFTDDPKEAGPSPQLLTLIEQLNTLQNTKVVLISGRDKETLGGWWEKVPIDLICEHGVWLRPANQDWRLTENVKCDWMKTIRPVLETYVDRTPGTFIEEKNYSLAWHYRKTNPGLGEIRANELSNVLKDMVSNHGLSVLEGNKVLEIKSSGVNKGRAATKALLGQDYDFIFAIGDDWTDEYLFEELPKESITIKVGIKKTNAKYYVKSIEEVKNFLKEFTLLSKKTQK